VLSPTAAGPPGNPGHDGPAARRAAHASGARAAEPGRVGPNAIVRVAEALVDRIGPDAAQALFGAAGIVHHLLSAPGAMVDEDDVGALQAQLRRSLAPHLAEAVCEDAGRRTGDYLLAHRIPRAAQAVLKLLPAGLAARVLTQAIARHAWTFAGSGTFSYTPGKPFVLRIAGCPLCRRIRADGPVCHYYAATFERIFRALVSPRTRVVEIECEAAGGRACTFEANW
jgi:divinyl protochlorophyllide a 8-vinyl-reductase